ncbi:MAG TPA: N-acetylglucosamine-6-phosphate deacetylase [Gaiellaceae bacterium]|jgi:N-acetylglucosamine-6-phosphate deacetylase
MRLGVEAALVDGALVPGDVEVVDGAIAGYGLAGSNGRGRIAVPGFIDLQVNGFGGVDFMGADADGYRRGGDALLETGVTAYLPTFISAPEEDLLAALGNVPVGADGPRILGVHLEGPFISPRRLGVHPASARRDPDPALLQRLLGAGPVRLMTLAPELPGAGDLIDQLLLAGVAVSAGHTNASAEEATAAFDRGVRSVTHIFNAMRPFGHRDPGLAGAALARDDVVVQVILDGVHLAEETARLIWSSAGGRAALVTDAVAGAGMGDGAYLLGGSEIEVRGGVVRGLDDVLAGSALTMIEAVRNLHELGVSLSEAVAAATAVPARVLGVSTIGRIGVELAADLVVLDDNLEIDRVCVGGEARVVA